MCFTQNNIDKLGKQSVFGYFGPNGCDLKFDFKKLKELSLKLENKAKMF